MLSEEELLQLTGGEEYSLEELGGGFQGKHWRLKTHRKSYFLKAEAEGGYDTGAFAKEPQVYLKLFPTLEEYTSGRQLWPFPVLARKGLLILEDLKGNGWAQEDVFGHRQISAALRALARFHGASILLDQRLSLMEHFEEAVVETYFGPSPALRTWEAFKGTAAKIYAKYFLGRRYQSAIALMDVAPRMSRPSVKFKNCLCHGDPWPNNIFFKYDSDNGDEACFVDFAQTRYCPPSADVLLFLHLLQTDDIDGYLQLYHSYLSAVVPSFNLEEFLDSCSEMRGFALSVAPLYVYLTRLPPAVIQRISQTPGDFTEFAMGGDSPALEAMDSDHIYRAQVVRAFGELLDFAEKKG